MKKIKLTARLLPPSNLLYYGGSNKYIFSTECNLEELQLPDYSIFDLLSGYIAVKGVLCRVIKSDKKSGLICLEGSVSSSKKQYLKKLISDGWVLSKDATKHHNIEVT